jgi:hypothetical protein
MTAPAGLEIELACPFFVPTKPWEGGGWLHISRLPLGGGWQGHCGAPGHEGAAPEDHEVRESCNLGYAAGCARLPKERKSDAVRFSIAKDFGDKLIVTYVAETAHLPVDHAQLEYQVELKLWLVPHPEPRIQKLAECYVEAYLGRRISPSTIS